MTPVPHDISDAGLIAFIDAWAGLLEREDYAGALMWTAHEPSQRWTAALLREVVETYGSTPRAGQRVTVSGTPTAIRQRKVVEWFEDPADDDLGSIWYDLNIDGVATDLTATFSLQQSPAGMIISLDDIHVM